MMQYIIPAAALIIVQIIISYKQQRVQDVKNEYLIKEVQEDIKRLETKQDKHNSLIERMAVVERDQKTAFRLIDELKEREGK
ncbi:hypothetical protein [Hominibacterium faecale]|uniref:Uncharacterized protein n=1 Tax=Hominibacterium faecale TaxID=2839743 RepID=A0A9J6QZK0_9FIRM|nr:hypothetical protein [Hominibacterium faecale]MCU7380958.1 hypothetical protein [Hominibacterium faecale]